MARRLACLLAAAAATVSVLYAAPASAADSTPVLSGTYTGALTITKDWGGSGFGFKPGTRTAVFSQGCKVGSACTVTFGANGSGTAKLTPSGQGFSSTVSQKSGCFDRTTGAQKSATAFDQTIKLTLTPTATEARGGVTYVTKLSGTYDQTFAVNATGRALDCTVDPNRTQSETETGTYSFALAPLAKPMAVAKSAPLALPGSLAGSTGGATGSQPPAQGPATPLAQAGPTDTVALPRFGLPQTATQVANADAVDAGRRTSVAGALVTPQDAVASVQRRLGKDLLLVALLGLLLVFPAQLFNSTYDANSDRIKRFWRRGRSEPKEPGRFRRVGGFLLVTVVGALLAGFLDPSFGLNVPSYALVVGVLASVLVALVVGVIVGGIYRSGAREDASWQVSAIPASLLFAVLCLAVSRLTGFEPGYLYGALGGAAFLVAMSARNEGRADALGVVVTFGLAIAAWVGFAQVNSAANAEGATFATLSSDAFLAALFIGGLEGLLFALVPITFLPGARIWAWSKVVWVLLFAVVGYVFTHVLLAPESGYLGRSTDANTAVTLALFVLFGGGSILFWLYFKIRPTKETAEPPDVGQWRPVETAGSAS